MSLNEHELDKYMLRSGSPEGRYLVTTLTRMEQSMSDLTDKIDTALTALQSQELASADTITQQQATITAAAAAAEGLQAQISSLAAGKAADEAELQKVLDVLNALQNPPGTAAAPTTAAVAGTGAAPVDPAVVQPVDPAPTTVADPSTPAQSLPAPPA